MSTFTIALPNGTEWTPRFAQNINQDKCIGCGRCFKVCGRDVLQLMGVDEEGEFVSLDSDEDDEYEKKVMSIAHPENCVGCEACSKICPKKCYTHAPLMMA
jgi:Nif-specific ferredoxin III